MVVQATIRYTGPGGGPKLSILHFKDGALPNEVAAQLSSICDNLKAFLSNQYAVTYDPTMRTLDTVTGALISESAFAVAPATYAGTAAAQPVPDAVAALVRLRTGVVVGGRFLQGRMFVPGLSVGLLTAGNITPVAVGQIGTEVAEALAIGPAGQWVVWSRKNGQVAAVNGVTAWAELATQRRRRG